MSSIERPLNIVYVWDADYPWDVRAEKLCAALTSAGHTVQIVARNKRWDPTSEQLPEGGVLRMPPLRFLGRRLDHLTSFPAFFNPRWVSLVWRAIRVSKTDCVIVRDLPLCPTAVVLARLTKIPIVLDMAEDYPAMMQALWETRRNKRIDFLVRNPAAVRAVERWCVKAVDHILVVVEESFDRLVKLGVPPARVTVVSNTPSISRISDCAPARYSAGDQLRVTYLGNLEVGRGLLESIDAVALLRDRGVRVQLRIIGDGRDSALIRSRADEHRLSSEWVVFEGFVPYQRAVELLRESHVGLVPHRANLEWLATIPNKLFDYMAAGLPVVASNVPPVARVLTKTNAGVLFESENAESLADALESIASPGCIHAMSASGVQAVRDCYNWEHDSEALLHAISGVSGP